MFDKFLEKIETEEIHTFEVQKLREYLNQLSDTISSDDFVMNIISYSLCYLLEVLQYARFTKLNEIRKFREIEENRHMFIRIYDKIAFTIFFISKYSLKIHISNSLHKAFGNEKKVVELPIN